MAAVAIDEPLTAARSGDRQALGDLLAEHQNACYGFALRLTGNGADAEDLCQEAFMRAAERIAQYQPTGSFRAWLLRIVFRVHLNRTESEKARKAREERRGMDQQASPQGMLERLGDHELLEAARAALAGLERKYSLPIALHYEQGLSYDEAAAVLEMPRGTVATNIRRGLERVRETLASKGFACTTAALAATLQSAPGTIAPASLAAAIHSAAAAAKASAAAGATGAAGGAGVNATAGGALFVKAGGGTLLAAAKLKLALVVAAVAVAGTVGVPAVMHQLAPETAEAPAGAPREDGAPGTQVPAGGQEGREAPAKGSKDNAETKDPKRLREAADEDLRRLGILVPGFKAVPLTGSLTLAKEQGLTVDDLRGKELDPNPPVPSGPRPKYDPRQADDGIDNARPYLARGIRPFRFREFHCEFNYGGWHNYDMTDYAVQHGFEYAYPYIRKVEETASWPQGARIMHWMGFVNWDDWLPAHKLPAGRYDLLMDLDLPKLLLDEGRGKLEAGSDRARDRADLLMIDMEHPVLAPEKLRAQDWYPKGGTEAERAAFEKKYYDGYARTYIEPVRCARKQGWKNLSIYGWAPYGRTWGGLEQPEAEPGAQFAWNAFGRQILDEVDIVNNSVYCFYWSPKNVAYVLENMDRNRELVLSAERPKPIRPYTWTLMHGGGPNWRWWRGLPLANEEMRALTAALFFAGVDGFVAWNWSGTGTHQRVNLKQKTQKTQAGPDGKDVKTSVWEPLDAMIGTPFTAADTKGVEDAFARYEALHAIGFDETKDTIRFQRILPARPDKGLGDAFPVFEMDRAKLEQLLRPQSEAVAGMIEGMALARAFETLLRHGEVKIDVDAGAQWKGTLPIVRRVRFGVYHLLFAYDPAVVYGGAPREIVLQDFDGVKGRTLNLPADANARIFLLQE
ncbi:MAG: RNA polymerase sigma factor [Planctomycetota bacterium]|nr:RNA polymerase sigma factor [Planctomycetota bacterium]